MLSYAKFKKIHLKINNKINKKKNAKNKINRIHTYSLVQKHTYTRTINLINIFEIKKQKTNK